MATSYSLAPGASPEDLAIRRKLALQLSQQGMDTSPVDHWTQGLARVLQGGLGGYELGQMRREEATEKEVGRKSLVDYLERMSGGAAPQHPQGPITSGPRPATAPPAIEPPPRTAMAYAPAGVDAGVQPMPVGAGANAIPTPGPQVSSGAGIKPSPTLGQVASRGSSALVDALMSRFRVNPGGGGGGWAGEGAKGSIEPVDAAGAGVDAPLQRAEAGAGVEPPPAPPPPPMNLVPQQPGMDQYGKSIASIESGGRYDLMGPVTRTGDRAHGKYQVMGANIGPWSEAALGRRVTPQEFLASPEIQEKVFQHRFGQYVQRYGPEGAARAWFAGEGGMNDNNRRDQLGTSVQSYADRFNAGIGGQQPIQVAQAGGRMPVGAAPQSAPPSTPQMPMGASAAQPRVTPQQAAELKTLLGNKFTAPIAQQIITSMMQAPFKEPKDQVVGDKLVRIHPDGRVQVIADATKATDDERNLAAENKARAARGMPQLSITEFRRLTKSEEKLGTEEGEAAATIPQAQGRVDAALQGIQQLRNHPGRLHGFSSNLAGALQGTPQYDFKKRVDQLKGGAFLEAFQMLKGGGAVTVVEGQKASEALERMDRALSKQDFDTALNDYESAVRSGFAKLQQKAGMSSPQGQPSRGGVRQYNPQTGRIE